MWTSPIQSFDNSGDPLVFKNPANVNHSSACVAAQVSNVSGLVVNVTTEFGVVQIQPFSATSIPVTTQDVTVTAVFILQAIVGYLSVSWMLPGEHPPQPDGPLRAAAVIAAQVQTVTPVGNSNGRNPGTAIAGTVLGNGTSDLFGGGGAIYSAFIYILGTANVVLSTDATIPFPSEVILASSTPGTVTASFPIGVIFGSNPKVTVSGFGVGSLVIVGVTFG